MTKPLTDGELDRLKRCVEKRRQSFAPWEEDILSIIVELRSLRARPASGEVHLMCQHLIGSAQFLEAGLPPEGDGVKELGLKLRGAAALLRRLGASAPTNVVPPCDDKELGAGLVQCILDAKRSDGGRVADRLDNMTIDNIVLQITEGSDVLDKLIERHKRVRQPEAPSPAKKEEE